MTDDLAALGLTGREPPVEYIDGWAVMHRDHLTGRIELAYVEEGAGPNGADLWHFKSLQDCSQLLDENAAVRAVQAGKGWGDGLQHVASVPMNVWANRLSVASQQGDSAFIKRWLNDSDHAAFRTKSGKL